MQGPEQGPATPVVEIPNDNCGAVRVTAADFNGALPWDKAWDGSPFTSFPRWLSEYVEATAIRPHARGGTDYAQWDVTTESGPVVTCLPGDWIICDQEGRLDVVGATVADILIKSAEALPVDGARARKMAAAIFDYADINLTKVEAADMPTDGARRVYDAAKALVEALGPADGR